jgi:hypothetical protein
VAADRSYDGAVSLVARLEAEDARRVLDARLPWIAYARTQFMATPHKTAGLDGTAGTGRATAARRANAANRTQVPSR